MWIKYDDFEELEDRYFLVIGRALLLAQMFESMTKNTFAVFDTGKRMNEEGIDLNHLFDNWEKYLKLLLGAVVRNLITGHEIGEKDKNILIDAKNARNYIAHDSVRPCFVPSHTFQEIQNELLNLEENVRQIAEGYNLMSCWSYEFEEKEPRPFTISKTYAEKATEWVMSPVKEMFEDILIDDSGCAEH